MQNRPMQLDVNERIECAHTLASRFYVGASDMFDSDWARGIVGCLFLCLLAVLVGGVLLGYWISLLVR